jgi:hypothetical protein
VRPRGSGLACPALLAVVAVVVPMSAAAQRTPEGPSDATLAARVGAALASSADLPADSITVQVRDGIVILSGSVVCDGCGGRSTPGGTGTVQQSLGAVVRAVPGVERVEFRLRYAPS